MSRKKNVLTTALVASALIIGSASYADRSGGIDVNPVPVSTYKDGSADNGGAFYQAINSTISEGTKFLNNTATNYGGAIRTTADTETNITGALFDGNKAEGTSGYQLGAAMFISGKANIQNSTFTNNEAVGDNGFGGAIYASTSSDVDISNSTFSYNKAASGGALALFKAVKLTDVTVDHNQALSATDDGAGGMFLGSVSTSTLNSVNGSKFEYNTSAAAAGAIGTRNFKDGNNQAAALDIIGIEFSNNTAATTGGAIDNYFYNSANKAGSVYVEDSEFNSNTAKHGGAIYNHVGQDGDTLVDGNRQVGSMYIKDSTFTGNTATSHGGAIYNEGTMIVGGSFEGNTAYKKGGAIYNTGTLKVTDGTIFTANTTTWDGAAGSGPEDTNANGGAIWNSGELTIGDDVTFLNNHASNSTTSGNGHGSDIYNTNGNIYIGKNLSILRDENFHPDPYKHDCAIFTNGGSITIGENASISEISEGIVMSSDASLNIGDGFQMTNVNNGIDNWGTGNVTIGSDAVFDGTYKRFITTEDNNGSKVTIGDNATFKNATTITFGSIYNGTGNEIEFTGTSEFKDNVALTNNAGVFQNFNGTLKFDDDATFSGNAAAGDAGALRNRNANSSSTFDGYATFENNSAGGNGGAVINEGTLTFNNGSLFTDNTAQGLGGAVHNKGTLNLKGDNYFSGNVASGVANDIYNTGTINVDGSAYFESGITGNGTINLGASSLTNIMNEELIGSSVIEATTINVTSGAQIALDWGDTINATTISGDALKISNLYIDGIKLTDGAKVDFYTGDGVGAIDGTDIALYGKEGKYTVTLGTGDDAKKLVLSADGNNGLTQAIDDTNAETVFSFSGEHEENIDSAEGVDVGNLNIIGDAATENDIHLTGTNGIEVDADHHLYVENADIASKGDYAVENYGNVDFLNSSADKVKNDGTFVMDFTKDKTIATNVTGAGNTNVSVTGTTTTVNWNPTTQAQQGKFVFEGNGHVVLGGDAGFKGNIINSMTDDTLVLSSVVEGNWTNTSDDSHAQFVNGAAVTGTVTNDGTLDILTSATSPYSIENGIVDASGTGAAGLLNIGDGSATNMAAVLESGDIIQKDLHIFGTDENQASLTANASNLKIKNDIDNDGHLILTGGTLSNNVGGDGRTVINTTGTVGFNDTTTKIAQTVYIDAGKLTLVGGNIEKVADSHIAMKANTELELTGGDLQVGIKGYEGEYGNLNVTGNATLSNPETNFYNTVSDLTIGSGVTLTNSGTSTPGIAVFNDLYNNGTITNSDGVDLLFAKAGNVSNDGTINGAGSVTIGDGTKATVFSNTANGTITGNDIIISESAKLITDAGNISDKDNSISNAGTLELTGGDLRSAVTGVGTTVISGDVNTNGHNITQETGGISVAAGTSSDNNIFIVKAGDTVKGDIEVNNLSAIFADGNINGDVTLKTSATEIIVRDAGTVTGDIISDNNGAISIVANTADALLSQISGTIKGTTDDGTYKIKAQSSGSNTATVDKAIAGASVISVLANSKVNITDTAYTSTSADITAYNNSTVTLDNTTSGSANITSAIIAGSGTYDLNIVNSNTTAGTTVIGKAITGADDVNIKSGNVQFNDTVTSTDLTVDNGTKLTSSASNLLIENAITNNGTVELTGGNLTQKIANATNSTVEINAGTGTVVINDGGTGNGEIEGGNLALTSGTLDLQYKTDTSTGDINLSTLNIIGGSGAISVQDDRTGKITLGDVDTTAGALNLAIDAKLSQETAADVIYGDSSKVTGDNGIKISNINITADPDKTEFTLHVADTGISQSVTTETMTISGGGGTGSLLLTYDKGSGNFTGGHSNLENAIKSTVAQKAYVVGDGDLKASGDLTLGGTSLAVTANNKTIEGNGNTISLGNNGQTLSISGNAGETTGTATVKGFATAIDNAVGGDVNLTNVTFENNTTDVNNGAGGDLGISGTVELSSKIENAGNITMAENSTLTGGTSINNKSGGKIVNTASGATIETKINNASGATVTTNANGFTGGISNNGLVRLIGGADADNSKTTQSQITGTGTTYVGEGHVTAGRAIKQDNLNIKQIDDTTGATLTNASGNNVNIKNISVEKNATLDNQGDIKAGDSNSNKITVAAGGNVVNGSETNTSAIIRANIDNSGTVDNYGKLAKTGKIDNKSGAELNNKSTGEIGADIDNSGIVNNEGTINKNSDVQNNAGATINNTGTIAGAITNDGKSSTLGAAILNTTASGITGGVANDGVVNIAGSALTDPADALGSAITNSLYGTGVTNIAGNVSTDKDITQATVNVGVKKDGSTAPTALKNDATITASKKININDQSSVTSDADKLIAAKGIVNEGELNLKGGTDATSTKTTQSAITGSGTTNITEGHVTAGRAIKQDNLNIKQIDDTTGATLTNASGNNVNIKNISVEKNATLDNQGDIKAGDSNSNKITVAAGGNVVNGSETNTSAIIRANIDNSGTVDNYGKLAKTGKIDNKSGAELNNKSTGEIGADIDNSGTVNNEGTINKNSEVQNNNGGTINNTGNIAGPITNAGESTAGAGDAGIVNTTAKGFTGGIKNDGIVNLNDGAAHDKGALVSAITNGAAGTGVTNIADTISTNGNDITQDTVNIGSNGTTTPVPATLTNDDKIEATTVNVTTAGTLDNNDTIAATNINNNGTTNFNDGSDVDATGTITTGANAETNFSGGNVDAAAIDNQGGTNTFDGADIGATTPGTITNTSGSTAISAGNVNATTITNKGGTTNITGGNINASDSITNTDGETNISSKVNTPEVNAKAGAVNIDGTGDDQLSDKLAGENGTKVNITDGANVAVTTDADNYSVDNAVNGDTAGTGDELKLIGKHDPDNAQKATTDGETQFTIDAHVKDATISLESGHLNLPNESNLENTTIHVGDEATLNTMDGNSSPVNSNVNFDDQAQVKMDVDARAKSSDSFTNPNEAGNEILTDVQLANLDTIVRNNTNINLKDTSNLQGLIVSEELQNKKYQAMTPIRIMEATINRDGMMNIHPSSGRNDYSSFNPAIVASPVAAQLGGYLTQLNSYDEAFRNMDMYMLMTKKQRQALKLRNKYAAAGQTNIVTYDPNQTAMDHAGAWFRPYVTFEQVNLKHGPNVTNTAYGSYFGGESEMKDLGHGWDGMWGAYVGYNGSHQTYRNVGIYQNGGTLGLVGMAYKGDFFTGLTINTGANAAEASTFYGHENFAMLMAGIASKTGYNWELAKGSFIIQPSFLASYSFVNTFDYTNAAGVRISSSPLHAIQLEPGIKFIGNLKNGWQPYLGVSMVWNIMDTTNFHANDIALPELSVKPFVKYGVGVRKTWGERLTGFFQAFMTNGGRNGVGLQAGFRWSIGKNLSTSSRPSSTSKASRTVIKKSKASASSPKVANGKITVKEMAK